MLVTNNVSAVTFQAKRLADNKIVEVHVVPVPYHPVLGNMVWWQKPERNLSHPIPQEDAFPLSFAAIDNQQNVHGYMVVQVTREPTLSLYIEHFMSARWVASGEGVDLPQETSLNSLKRVGWTLFARACKLHSELGGKADQTSALWFFAISQAREVMGKMMLTTVLPELSLDTSKLIQSFSGELAYKIAEAVSSGRHLLV
ncbi:MAG: hypothetical protein NT099_02795 [Candidatus Saganbacteria bacterium]|nr:hypothetical protein [Candidatus Saganbacteria bacterium]